jgi:hypothetical protein
MRIIGFCVSVIHFGLDLDPREWLGNQGCTRFTTVISTNTVIAAERRRDSLIRILLNSSATLGNNDGFLHKANTTLIQYTSKGAEMSWTLFRNE